MKFLPRFIRRAVLLRRARRLVEAGDGRAALTLLSDPLFDGIADARALARAAEASLPAQVTGTRASITDLLAQLREERARRGGGARTSEAAPAAGATDDARDTATSRAGQVQRAAPPKIAFRLAVDDAGEFLVVVGLEFTLGHTSSAHADLPLLANVEREHLRLIFTDDFHTGPAWRIEPIGGARSSVRGRALAASGSSLADGDQVVLGQNSSFRFRASDMSSSSAVLELEHGIECRGAGRILVVVPGSDGRVSLGSSSNCTIRAAQLEHDVTLEVTLTTSAMPEARLSVGCSAGIARGVRPKEGDPTALSILVPPEVPERFTCGARSTSTAPFEIVLAPLLEENTPR